MFKFEKFNFEVIIPRCGVFVNTETAFCAEGAIAPGGEDAGRGAAEVRQTCRGDAAAKKGDAAVRDVTGRRGEWDTAEVIRAAAGVIRVSGRGCFRRRGALQESENMIYLLHSRTSCGGDMTDFGDLPRDAGDGARCASSPRGNVRIRRSAFCGRVIFGGKI